jgi:hypothetical protein
MTSRAYHRRTGSRAIAANLHHQVGHNRHFRSDEKAAMRKTRAVAACDAPFIQVFFDS